MLTTLRSIVQEVAAIPSFRDALDCLALRVKESMGVDCCSVYLTEAPQSDHVLMATEGLSKSAIGIIKIAANEGLVGLVAQREEPINVQNAQQHPRFKFFPEADEEAYHSFLGAPIIHQRRVLGVITVQHTEKRPFSQDEESFLVTLAAQMALEIVHARTRGELNIRQENKTPALSGVSGSDGFAIGESILYQPKLTLKQYGMFPTKDPKEELAIFKVAVRNTRQDIATMAERMRKVVPKDAQSIFSWYQQLLDANSLGAEVELQISEGWTAGSALKRVVEQYRIQFDLMQDDYMKERIVDIEDLGNRVLAHIINDNSAPKADVERGILVAEEVTASMLAEYPAGSLAGVVSQKGSRNSHAAILARAMDIPAVMGIGDLPLTLLQSTLLVVDGYSGEVFIAPEGAVLEQYSKLAEQETKLHETMLAEAEAPMVTLDGVSLNLYLNAGLAISQDTRDDIPCDGIGLFRTEVPFMLRERFPSEGEQVKLYEQILKNFHPLPVTMRTLDVGGDKPLPYFPVQEENPFLGWRGIRITLDHPEIFLVQVRAMIKANATLGNLRIMLPMITAVNEVTEAKRLIEQAWNEVREELDTKVAKPLVGIMLEVPAVLYQLKELSTHVDFFSVGTNDLTQYMLAVDRNNARVAPLYDNYHPSVLRALFIIVTECGGLDKPVSICGELASEPAGALLLMAMGYRELSMSAKNLAKIKWLLRRVDTNEVESLLQDVLSCQDPQQVHKQTEKFIETAGFGALLRAGN